MKKENLHTTFYENPFILGVWLLLIGGFLLFFGYSLVSLSCPSLILKALISCPFAFGAFIFLYMRLTSVKKGFVEISKKEIFFQGIQLQWSEVTCVKMEWRNWRKMFLRLRIECGKIPYFINLRFMSDAERKLLLDEIERYIPVHYIKCQYNRNYTLWEIIPLTIVLIFLIFGYILSIYKML